MGQLVRIQLSDDGEYRMEKYTYLTLLPAFQVLGFLHAGPFHNTFLLPPTPP